MEVTDYRIWNYYVPWTRCQPYIIGIITGFLLNKYKDLTIEKTIVNRLVASIGWILAIITGLAIIYGLDVEDTMFFGINAPSRAENVIYGSFHRLAWAMCLAWLILACHYGLGGMKPGLLYSTCKNTDIISGWINDFLSWEAFAPLSRLTFVMFLVHQSVINVLAAQFSFSYEGTPFFMVFTTHIFISVV